MTVNAKRRHMRIDTRWIKENMCQGDIPVRGLIGYVNVVYRTSVQTAVCVALKHIDKGSADRQEICLPRFNAPPLAPEYWWHCDISASGSIPRQVPNERNSDLINCTAKSGSSQAPLLASVTLPEWQIGCEVVTVSHARPSTLDTGYLVYKVTGGGTIVAEGTQILRRGNRFR